MAANGHGIFSQFTAEHQKQWIRSERRRSEESANNLLTQHTAQVQQRPVSLKDLRKTMVASTNADSDSIPMQQSMPSPTSLQGHTEKHELPPHMAHHHHFGWGLPQRERPVAYEGEKRQQYNKYGDALGYCQKIASKSMVLTSREP